MLSWLNPFLCALTCNTQLPFLCDCLHETKQMVTSMNDNLRSQFQSENT